MIAFLASLALRAGVPQRLSRTVGIAAGVIALIVALGITKCAYDKSIVDQHEAKISTKVERNARAAEHRADAVTNPITKQNAAEQAERQEAIRNATDQHPEESRRPIGPASSAVLDRLRDRQRKAGKTGR